MPHSLPTVGDYMSPSPLTIHPEQSLVEALEIMESEAIRHLPVVKDGHLCGILSLRDLQVLKAVKGLSLDSLSVDDVTAETPYNVPPETPICFVARYMASRRYGSAVVVDRGNVVGIFTTVDALRALDEIVTRQEAVEAGIRA